MSEALALFAMALVLPAAGACSAALLVTVLDLWGEPTALVEQEAWPMKAGDVVGHLATGERMTVEAVDGKRVRCTWWCPATQNFPEDDFAAHELGPAPPVPPGTDHD